MVSSISNSSLDASYRLNKLFSKIDSNEDGSVSRAEFISGKPDTVSSAEAGQLFDQLDSQKTGTLSQADFVTAFQQMDSQMRSSLIQAQSSGSGDDASGGTSSGISQLFAKLDANSDGTVSRDEFVAGKPDGMTADQAGALYDKIAGTGSNDTATTTGLTEEQLANGLQTVAGHHRHHHARSNDQSAPSDDQTATTAASQTDPGQILDQLLAALQSAVQAASGNTQQDSDSPPDPARLFSTLDTNGDGKVSRDEFISGKPQSVSTDQAGAFFDKIANGNGDTLTQDQFVSGFNATAPASQESASSADTASQADPGKVLDQLLAALKSSTDSGGSSSDDSTATGTATPLQLFDQLVRAINSYQSETNRANLAVSSTASVAT